MARVAVIGAGIAGLTAAHRLLRLGLEPTIFEASERVGGVIYSERSSGFLVEHGPNSVQSTPEAFNALLNELDLAKEQVSAGNAALNRYVVRDGELVAFPTSPYRFITSDLFTLASKLRLLLEPFIAPADPADEESIADFVRRRLGSELLDYGLDPFVAGIYAGNPERLSVKHALPTLYELEQEAGSLFKGLRARRRTSATHDGSSRMFSFSNGLGRLPEALAGKLARHIHMGIPVTRVNRTDEGWMLHFHGRAPVPHDAVIYAAPLHVLPELDLPSGPLTDALANVTYAPVCTVSMGFRREHVGHLLDGFGMLVPTTETPSRILGTVFSSTLFPNRAPDGHVLLTTFVGGMRDREIVDLPERQVYDITERDLRILLHTSGNPVFRSLVRWQHAIPQYTVGYGATLETIGRLEETWPGWYMTGNYRNGVSVGATVDSADRVARRCAEWLARS